MGDNYESQLLMRALQCVWEGNIGDATEAGKFWRDKRLVVADRDGQRSR